MVKNNFTTTRRSVLKSLSASAGLSIIPAASAQKGSSQSQPNGSSEHTHSLYEIQGTKKITTKYNKDEFRVKTKYISKDLNKVIGKNMFIETDVIDRPQPSDDDLPIKGVKNSTEPWHTYIATESGWRAAKKQTPNPVQSANSSSGVTIQHDHQPEEDDFCGIAVWDYEKVRVQEDSNWGMPIYDYVYNVKSPINIICKGYDVEDVENILDDEGWFDEDDLNLQYSRYAWDVDRETFAGPGQESQSEYSEAVSHRAGFLGRMHAKFWELEDGIVSIQAHEDTAAPHSVKSYLSAQGTVVDILLENGGKRAETPNGFKNLGNSKGDHGGYAHVIVGDYDSINRSC